MSNIFKEIPIEEVKKYWDKAPCGFENSSKPIGAKEYFDEIERIRYLHEPHILDFVDFHKWNGKKVLEIGCGIGTDTIDFARAGAQVTAVDLSQESLDLAKKRAKVYKLEDKIKFYLGNAEELSKIVPIQRFDLVYSYGVIHHTPNPEKVIEEIKKFMDSRSVLKIMLYHRYSWNVLRILISKAKFKIWKLDEFIAKYSEGSKIHLENPITYTFSKRAARKLLKDFNILEIKIRNFPIKVADFVPLRYKHIFKSIYIPKFIHKFFERSLGWNLLITAIVKK